MSEFEFEIKEIQIKKIRIQASGSAEALREVWNFYETKKDELNKINPVVEVEIKPILEQMELFDDIQN